MVPTDSNTKYFVIFIVLYLLVFDEIFCQILWIFYTFHTFYIFHKCFINSTYFTILYTILYSTNLQSDGKLQMTSGLNWGTVTAVAALSLESDSGTWRVRRCPRLHWQPSSSLDHHDDYQSPSDQHPAAGDGSRDGAGRRSSSCK